MPVACDQTVEKITDTRGDDLHYPEKPPGTAEISKYVQDR